VQKGHQVGAIFEGRIFQGLTHISIGWISLPDPIPATRKGVNSDDEGYQLEKGISQEELTQV
jgi:hypothetical protein